MKIYANGEINIKPGGEGETEIELSGDLITIELKNEESLRVLGITNQGSDTPMGSISCKEGKINLIRSTITGKTTHLKLRGKSRVA